MPRTFALLAAVIVIATAATAIAADGKPVLVSVVGKDLKSTMGELGRENDANIEVFDLKTGQGQIFKKADLQTISKDVAEASAIDRVGLSAFMAWRIKKVLPVSFATGKIAQIDGTVVYVSIGSKVGIEEGQELTVYRGATEIRDPDTGEVLGKQRRKVAKLEAIEVDEKLTKAKLIGDLETSLQVGDIVEPAVVSNSVAVLPLVNHRGHETVGTKRIAEELTTGLVNREISVIERRLLDKVLGELSLQQGSGFDTAKAQKVGKQLGAYAIVIGSVTPKAKYAEAQLRLVRVETGEIMVAATQTFREVGDLLGSTPGGKSSKSESGDRFTKLSLDANSLREDFTISDGRWNLVGRGGLEFPARKVGTEPAKAVTKAIYSYPISVKFTASCGKDGVYDIWPGVCGVRLIWGIDFNKRTDVWIGRKKIPLEHKPIVPERAHDIQFDIDDNRQLSIHIDGKEILRTVVDESVELSGPIILGGGSGHVFYSSVLVRTR